MLGLDEDHAQEDDGVPESSMSEVNDDPDPPDLGFDPGALGSGGRERGHRGRRGVTSTSFSTRGGISRGGFIRSGLQGLSLFSPSNVPEDLPKYTAQQNIS